MTAPTHIAFSLSGAIALCRISACSLDGAGFLLLVLGSLAPDIDTETSTISKPGSILRRLIPRVLADLLDTFTQLISKLIRIFIGHRGAMHWPIIPLVLIAISKYLEQELLFWFAWGYLFHILGDFCTAGGIQLLGPFNKKFYSWSPLKTGSASEKILFVILLCFIVVYGFALLPEENQFWLETYLRVV